MGTVYEAEDTELERRVALKALEPDEAGSVSEERLRRLRREARALARLRHPNVVPIFEVGADQGRPFVAMQLIEGVSLREWLGARDRSWREVIDVVSGAGRGLAAAHDAGVVHRDFKPDNVVVDSDGGARVVDFGLARSIDDSTTALTRDGAVIGTLAYIAPELLDGGSATPASDQFSFAVTVYEALYGERPFGGETLEELASTLARGQPTLPEKSQVPSAVGTAVLRALSSRPEDRYPTVDRLVDELDGISSDDRVGTVVGDRYRIVERIARGGMGVVYRALDSKRDSDVALKLLPPSESLSSKRRARLAREARAAGSIEDPGIAAIYDAGDTADGGFFIAMELVEGSTLRELIRERRLGREADGCPGGVRRADARCRPLGGNRPSRRQTRQHHDARRRERGPSRLRVGEGGGGSRREPRHGPHARRRRRRHDGLPVAGAGAGRSRRPRLGSVLTGHHDVRGPDRGAALVRGTDRHRRADPHEASTEPPRSRSRFPAGPRRCPPARAVEGPRGSLRVAERVCRRAGVVDTSAEADRLARLAEARRSAGGWRGRGAPRRRRLGCCPILGDAAGAGASGSRRRGLGPGVPHPRGAWRARAPRLAGSCCGKRGVPTRGLEPRWSVRAHPRARRAARSADPSRQRLPRRSLRGARCPTGGR